MTFFIVTITAVINVNLNVKYIIHHIRILGIALGLYLAMDLSTSLSEDQSFKPFLK